MKKDKLQYFGSRDELKNSLIEHGLVGEWQDNGQVSSYRARTGEQVNLYSNGTVNAQGKKTEATTEILRAICNNDPKVPSVNQAPAKQHIFIVHGHDENARNELELVLRRLNLNPYILQNENAASKTIIEALEHGIGSDAAFGIVLLTPDDLGYSLRDGEGAKKHRARQNVVLEMGMCMAALGREKMVIIKKKGEIELPSDTDGILRLEYAGRVQEQVAGLVQKMQDAGIQVDNALIASASK